MKPNYKNSILNVSNTILKHYGIDTPYKDIPILKEKLFNKKHIMLILLDGMGMNILSHLDKSTILRCNIKKSITSIFPPTTVAATTSVLSGLPPYQHGHVGWIQYNQFEHANTIVFLNKDAENPNHEFKEDFRRTYLKYPTILETIAKQNPDLKTYLHMPNFEKDGFDTFDQQIDRLIEISKKEPSFSYTYWTEPDLSIHTSGTKAPNIKNLLMTLNHSIERLYQEVQGSTAIIVIADHGMIDVEAIDLHDKTDLLDTLYRKPSIEPRATSFFIKLDQLTRFKQLFRKYFKHKFKLYTREQVYKKGLLGYGEKHPLMDDFIGDYMAIAHKKYMFSFRKEKVFLAHHAGLNKKEMRVPLIIIEKE